jgi:DNA-binding transcriptional regulator YdaS (Cro superfamily)
VTDGRIDRDAWAELMAALIESETRGKKAAFSRLIGVNTRTLDRWLAREVDVSEESVRSVARATNRPAMDLLIKVGYYRQDEVPGAASGEHMDPDVLIILRRLADPNTPEAERTTIREMLSYLASLAERPPDATQMTPRRSAGDS